MIDISVFKISLLNVFLLLGFNTLSQDITPPVFDDFEPEIDIECSELHQIFVTATDDSDDLVDITYLDDEFSGGCTPNILRTYFAEDSTGNVSTAYQIINVVDETPPVFIGAGEDMIMSCEEPLPEIPEVIVYDECQEEELSEFDFQTEFIDGICEQIIKWTWSATDECGNYGEHTKTITIVDETAPEFSEVPESYYVNCEDGFPPVPELEVTDNCTEVTVTFEEEIIEGGLDNGEASYCTVQDVEFFNQFFSMKLIASPAQENYTTSDLVFMQMPDMGEGSSATISGNIYGFENPNAGWYVHMEFENGMDWESWSNQDFLTSYRDDFNIAEETHLDWTYLLMNASNSEMIGLGEYEGSHLSLSHNPPNNYYAFQVGVGASNYSTNYGMSGWFQATGTFYDSESDDEDIVNGIEFDYAGDVYADLVCCPIETMIRTWTAEDECDNVTVVSQHITLIDVLSPEFTYVPEDLLLECSDEIPEDMAEAIDNCGEAIVTYEDEIEETECEGEYTIYRKFTATDNCGLTSMATQIITVQDTEAPIFINAPEDLVLDCLDEVPLAPEVLAEDACDSELNVEFTEEIIGDMGPEGAISYCAATTPINFEDGWSLIFFDEILGDLTATTVEGYFAMFEEDGEFSASIQATLQSTNNPNAGWYLEALLMNGMNWDDWSNQEFPTSYKDNIENSTEFFEEWLYFILTSGELQGWGDWEGTSISLSHAPENYYYGFQLGTEAANVNGEYGVGGWVHYSGTIYDEETDSVVLVDGAGDLAFDLNCCPMYSVVRTWEVSDCAGNSTSHTQEISFDNLTEEVPEQFVQEEFRLSEASLEDIFRVSVSPNPIESSARIVIDSKVSALATVDIYNSQGIRVDRLWSGGLSSDYEQIVELESLGLAPGVYMINLKTLSGQVSKKIVVLEK